MFVGMSKSFWALRVSFLQIKKLQATTAPDDPISHYWWVKFPFFAFCYEMFVNCVLVSFFLWLALTLLRHQQNLSRCLTLLCLLCLFWR